MQQRESRLTEGGKVIEQKRQRNKDQRLEMTSRLGQQRSISHEPTYFTPATVTEATISVARALLKLGNSARSFITLSEEQQENTRLVDPGTKELIRMDNTILVIIVTRFLPNAFV